METGFLDDSEVISRFVTFSKWFRPSDKTLKQDAFIPHREPEVSVCRQKGLSVSNIWEIGKKIASSQSPPLKLYGRADLTVSSVRAVKLNVLAQPVSDNENHAVIVGWPSDKPAQKIFAAELAAAAKELIPFSSVS